MKNTGRSLSYPLAYIPEAPPLRVGRHHTHQSPPSAPEKRNGPRREEKRLYVLAPDPLIWLLKTLPLRIRDIGTSSAPPPTQSVQIEWLIHKKQYAPCARTLDPLVCVLKEPPLRLRLTYTSLLSPTQSVEVERWIRRRDKRPARSLSRSAGMHAKIAVPEVREISTPLSPYPLSPGEVNGGSSNKKHVPQAHFPIRWYAHQKRCRRE